MSIRTAADSFRELGLQPPDMGLFEQRPDKLSNKFGREPIYNTRVLVDNWFEDRRQYKNLCHRCTGPTITQTDYQPYCPDDSEKPFPPLQYKRRLEGEGEGHDLLRNPDDYCQYLQNYTTTYDLMHNWEVRRAGVKPKPWRKWKMVHGSVWVPQNDNTVSFGNLTQLGYRKAGQLPLLPNDWDLYAHTGYQTETMESYPKRNYPEEYVQCRKTPKRELVREMQNNTQIKKPVDPRDPCAEASLYYAARRSQDEKCVGKCEGETGRVRNIPRFGNCLPYSMLKKLPSKQTLYLPKQPFPYKAMKHPTYLPNEPCRIAKTRSKEVPDYCRDYAGNTRFDFKGVFRDGWTP